MHGVMRLQHLNGALIDYLLFVSLSLSACFNILTITVAEGQQYIYKFITTRHSTSVIPSSVCTGHTVTGCGPSDTCWGHFTKL